MDPRRTSPKSEARVVVVLDQAQARMSREYPPLEFLRRKLRRHVASMQGSNWPPFQFPAEIMWSPGHSSRHGWNRFHRSRESSNGFVDWPFEWRLIFRATYQLSAPGPSR